MELPKNAFYKKTLDEEQQVFFDAIKNDQYTIVFCNAAAGTGKMTKNYRGWLSTYADRLEG